MTDHQPGEVDPAVERDPTRVEGGDERSTADAPARWSGSAAIPPPAPKKSWWPRRRLEPEDERTEIPAVDPWAGQDTPIDPIPIVLDPTAVEPPLPPTRVEPPAPAPQPPAPQPLAPHPPASPPFAPQPPASPPFAARTNNAQAANPPRANAAPSPAAPSPAAPPPTAPPPTAPPPVAPLPSGPPKLSRRERKQRERAAKMRPPVNRLPVQTRPPSPPAPPPWATPRPPQRPLPPPRRKRRRGRLFVFALFGVLCCCGLPFAYFQFPAARQYPVTAVLPTDFSDLSLRDDNASKRAADRLAAQLDAADSQDGQPFAGVYGDSRGKRVTVFGVTGWRFTPKSDVRAQLDRLADDFDLGNVQTFNLGETGAHESCGSGRADGTSVVVCAWADHGSMATVLLTRRSIDDSADLVSRLRSAVLTPAA
ncbi:hypothetical protein ACQPZX_07560 [Actinoplanes sp. CA-142083]|uniref:hypothetical protein n=1 Tax=Actinoplanes sp. CA-142083 TaxID=3239903 RepID=UPI003D939816